MHNVDKAVTEIRKQTPWIGIVLQFLGVELSENVKTAATNGKRVFVNPRYISTLTFAELMGVLVHEALHVIMRHMFRMVGYDQDKFNIAGDHAINGQVIDLGYVLPNGCLERIDNKTAERIYSELPDEPESDEPESGESGESDDSGESDESESDSGESESDSGESESDSGESESDSGESDSESESDGSGESESGESDSGDMGSDVMEYPLEPGQTMADAERELSDMLERAKTTAAICGDQPSEGERQLFEDVESDVDWQGELAEYIDKCGAADYSMLPPNLILGDHGIIANRLNPSGVGNVVLVVDNSTSMDADKLNQVVSELRILVDNIDYESLRVLCCDTTINLDMEFGRGEDIDTSTIEVMGGTMFTPAFEYIEDNCQPDLIIYFTDMEVWEHESPEYPPACPVIWAVYGEMLQDDGEWTYEKYGRSDWFTPDWGHRVKIK